MSLIFDPEKVRVDGDTDKVRFRAFDDDKLVLFAVTPEALKNWGSRRGRGHDDLLDLFSAAEVPIHQIAERKYAAGEVQADGVILITAKDLNG
jgi:hypothetical protein